jgi:hypothetical protein
MLGFAQHDNYHFIGDEPLGDEPLDEPLEESRGIEGVGLSSNFRRF